MEDRKPLDGLFSSAQLAEFQRMANAAAPFAQNMRQFAELSSTGLIQLQKMAAAAPPYLVQVAKLSDVAASRVAEIQQISTQLGPRLLEIQLAAQAIAPRVAEMARWAEMTTARFKEAQEAAAPTFEQMRRIAEIIRPQIVQLSQARELFDIRTPSSEILSPMLRIPVGNVATAGTSPQAISLTIGVAGPAVGLRPHEMLGVLAAETRMHAANDHDATSLAAEAVAMLEASTESSDAAFALQFLDQFITTAQSYLSKADSVPALKGLIQVITLMMVAASFNVYVAICHHSRYRQGNFCR